MDPEAVLPGLMADQRGGVKRPFRLQLSGLSTALLLLLHCPPILLLGFIWPNHVLLWLS